MIMDSHSERACITGTRDGRPHPTMRSALKWTAGQMIHISVASLGFLGPLLSDDAKKHTVWLSWVAHIEYFVMLMQTSFTQNNLDVLQQKIIYAHKLFLKVPEFTQLWIPKHHYALHFVEDMRRFGPARFYWCMRFEAKNQEFKKAALTGNFKEVPRTCSHNLCTQPTNTGHMRNYDLFVLVATQALLSNFGYDGQQNA